MRVFIFLIIGVCAIAAYADTQGTGAHDGQSDDGQASQAMVEESLSDLQKTGSDQAEQSAESPWQGTWTGSEMNPTGTRVSVTAHIRVTNGKISGTWRARGTGQRNITGQVNGKEASITILQGGSNIRATLVDRLTGPDTFSD